MTVDQIISFKKFRNNKEESRSNVDMDLEHSNIMAERSVLPPIQPFIEAKPPIEPTLTPNVLPHINDNPREIEVTNNENNTQRERRELQGYLLSKPKIVVRENPLA